MSRCLLAGDGGGGGVAVVSSVKLDASQVATIFVVGSQCLRIESLDVICVHDVRIDGGVHLIHQTRSWADDARMRWREERGDGCPCLPIVVNYSV